MAGDRYRAFISYSRSCAEWVEVLHRNLERCLGQRTVFVDTADIGPGQSWVSRVQAGLESSDRIVLVVTPESLASPRVEDEIESRVAEIPNWRRDGRVLVVVLADAPLPTFLAPVLRIDFEEAGETAYRRELARLVTGLSGLTPRNLVELPDGIETPPPHREPLRRADRAKLVAALVPLLGQSAYRKLLYAELKLADRFVFRDPHVKAERVASCMLVGILAGSTPKEALPRLLEAATRALHDDLPSAVEALRKAIDAVLREPPPPPHAAPQDGASAPARSPAIDPLPLYRQYLVEAHSRLIPFVATAPDKLLQDVVVDLDIEPGDGGRPTLDGLEKVRSGTLEAVLRQSVAAAGSTGPLPRWLVRGEPGAGKSTTARSLVHRLASDATGPVPIFVSVSRLVRHRGDLAAAAASTLAREDLREPLIERLRALLATRGAVWAFLDGFDEVPEPDLDDAWAHVEGAARQKDAVVVVLSRPIAVETRTIAGYGIATVRALDEARCRLLLTRLVGGAAADALLAAIRGHATLEEFARNPLLATLLALIDRDVREKGGSLPTDSAKLLGAAVDLLLRKGCALDRTAAQVKDKIAARRVLAAISMVLHGGPTESWPKPDLWATVDEVRSCDPGIDSAVRRTWTSDEAFLDDIGTRSGILGPHDGATEPWRYLHRALREYLAAERLIALPQARGLALFDAWTKDPPESRTRMAEVFHRYLVETKAPPERFAALAAASPELGLRALRGQTHVAADDRLRIVLDADKYEGKDVILAVRDHPDRDRAAAILWERATPKLTPDQIGRLLWALEVVGRPAERERLFRACGRWPKEGFPTLTFARIPEDPKLAVGKFEMGSAVTEERRWDDEGPVHKVTVPAFMLATTPVTAGQFRAFEPSRAASQDSAGSESLPVVDVSWWAARAFCAWIGARLPSEAEWEFACRAGTTTRFWSGDGDADLARVGWYAANAGQQLHPVGEKPANPWGLFDMHGNVYEWCEDAWHGSYQGAPDEGSAWDDEASSYRVVRGGSFWFTAGGARSAVRGMFAPGFRGVYLGFRPARSLTP